MSLVHTRFRQFLAAVGGRQNKPQQRFMRQMVGGILSARSVMLAEIVRALDEDGRFEVTESRLSRHMGNERFYDLLVEEDYLRFVEPHLHDPEFKTPVIAVDTTDIQKKNTRPSLAGEAPSRRMKHIAIVRDGSESSRKEPKLGPGYEMLSIEAVGEQGRRMPLCHRLFSKADPRFLSQVQLFQNAFKLVRPHTPERALWVFDSGFDNARMFRVLRAEGIRHVVRLTSGGRNSRHLWAPDGVHRRVEKFVDIVAVCHRFNARRFTKTKRAWTVDVGFANDVRLQAYLPSGKSTGTPGEERYGVVVVRPVGNTPFGKDPIVLLTSERVMSGLHAQRIAEAYLDRWGAEEAHRFIKQSWRLEPHFRCLDWTAARRMILLSMLAYGFLACLVCRDREEMRAIASTFKVQGPVPEYMFYRLTYGIGRLVEGILQSGP